MRLVHPEVVAAGVFLAALAGTVLGFALGHSWGVAVTKAKIGTNAARALAKRRWKK